MADLEKARGFFGEFKAFIARGNVMDMAVGVIVGGAFGKITTSLVNDIAMPAISMLTGGTIFYRLEICFKRSGHCRRRCDSGGSGGRHPLRQFPLHRFGFSDYCIYCILYDQMYQYNT